MKKILFILLFSIWGVGFAQVMTKKAIGVDRGFEKHTFIPEGQWIVGITTSYSSMSSTDYKFLILDDLDINSYSFSTRVLGGYCWKDDLVAGLSFDYSRSRMDLSKLDIGLGDGASIEIQDYYNVQQEFTGTAFLRAYLNLGKSNRFGLFNDVRLSFGGGRGRVTNGQGEEMTGTFQKIFRAGLILQPGLAVFITDYVAAEASMGLFGIRYTNIRQTTNQVYRGSYNSFDTSFRLNLLSINLGVTFYL